MKNRRKFIFANKLQRKIMLLIFIAATVPALIVGLSLYYLIFEITARQIAIPEMMASILFPTLQIVQGYLLISLPISIILLLAWSFIISHRLVGPYERLMNDIDNIASGSKTDHIHIRPKDDMAELVGKINRLLDRFSRR